MADQASRALAPVFLSASVPDPRRHEKYWATADVTSIREAVRALAIVVLQRRMLVFGGHPAIAPLIVMVAQRMGCEQKVRIFQSEYFRRVVPKESLTLPRITWTDDVDGDEARSLDYMRSKMLADSEYAAGVFIGGMDGVEKEFDLFRQMHPSLPVYPVASTGGAARLIWEKSTEMPAPIREDLSEDIVYDALFRSLPGVGN
jgi:hypothetical protein